MARKFVCDICGENVNEDTPKTIGNYDSCDICHELYEWSIGDNDNLKALITSIKMRKARLGTTRNKPE